MEAASSRISLTFQASTRTTFNGCCARFDPSPYRHAELSFHDELFVRETSANPFGLLLPQRHRLRRVDRLIAAARAYPKRWLLLREKRSPWATDFYIHVAKEVPGAAMVRLSGTFITHVFEGGCIEEGRCVAAMRDLIAARGERAKRLFVAHGTCPDCAKSYGEKQLVVFAQIR